MVPMPQRVYCKFTFFKLDPGTDTDTFIPDASGIDTTASHALKAAEFGLFSAGPDRSFNATLRYDDPDQLGNVEETSFHNEDNIVEVGP